MVLNERLFCHDKSLIKPAFLISAFSENQNNQLTDGVGQERDCILKKRANNENR